VDLTDSKNELQNALNEIDGATVGRMAAELIKALKAKKKILVCGNGGSAADAQHFAAELVCTFDDRTRAGLRAIALSTDTSILTAWSNDFGFNTVFERQVDALGDAGDILFCITTSGNSENIINAMKKAKEKGMKNIILSGKNGGPALKHADLSLVVASKSTPRIQECQIFVIHSICAAVDGAYVPKK